MLGELDSPNFIFISLGVQHLNVLFDNPYTM